jgi:hypothetical protein
VLTILVFRLRQELSLHAELIDDLQALGRDLAVEAALSGPPTVYELLLSWPGYVSYLSCTHNGLTDSNVQAAMAGMASGWHHQPDDDCHCLLARRFEVHRG